MKHNELKKSLFRDKKLKAEYNSLTPLYEIKSELIKIRVEQGLSQKELANLIGTKQSAISRLESGDSNPSVVFLIKVAEALGKTLHIFFVS